MTGWFAASYVWRKELPDLSAELARFKRKKPVPQTNEELLFVMQTLSARLGVPVKQRTRGDA